MGFTIENKTSIKMLASQKEFWSSKFVKMFPDNTQTIKY